MIEADYYWGEALRWNLWFANPNHAGAFLAMLLPWFWGGVAAILNRRYVWLALFLAKASLFYALCKTYSRGALVAAKAGLILFWIFSARARLRSGTSSRSEGPVTLGAGALSGSGFFKRCEWRCIWGF